MEEMNNIKNYRLLSWPIFNFFCLAFLFRFVSNAHYQVGNFILLGTLLLLFFYLKKYKSIDFTNSTWGKSASFAIFILLFSFISIYFLLRFNANLVHNDYVDPVIEQMDQHIVGTNLSVQLSHLITPWRTDLASMFYLGFFIYSFLSIYFYGLTNKNKYIALSFIDLYTTLYLFSFALYFLIPVAGPYLAMAHDLKTSLERNGISSIEFSISQSGTTYFDAFPSLHAAITCFIVFAGDMVFKPKQLVFTIPLFIGICWSTFYLRYHYATDVLCGLMLAAIATFIFYKRTSQLKMSPVL